jgi:hypothetical protein
MGESENSEGGNIILWIIIFAILVLGVSLIVKNLFAR